jgi:hypothetical protein
MDARRTQAIAFPACIGLVIILYFAGMFMALFGPAGGRFLGAAAFLGTVVVSSVLGIRRRGTGTMPGVAQASPEIARCRSVVSAARVACILVGFIALITLLASSGMAGVADGTKPIFAEQPTYRLNSHGTYTVVSRLRYVIVGSSFIVGWHMFGVVIALTALQASLFDVAGALGENSAQADTSSWPGDA